MVRQRQKLQGEEKASLQAAGVADRHNQVGGLAEEKVPRDLLLLGVGQKRIASGKVSDLIEYAFVANCAPGQIYGLSGPVARVLTQAGQSVKERAFPHIGISCKSDCFYRPFFS